MLDTPRNTEVTPDGETRGRDHDRVTMVPGQCPHGPNFFRSTTGPY